MRRIHRLRWRGARRGAWARAVGAAGGLAAALCALWSGADRFFEIERNLVRHAGSLAATCMLASLVWRVTPYEYVGLGWMALALVLLELGMRELPREFRRQSY